MNYFEQLQQSLGSLNRKPAKTKNSSAKVSDLLPIANAKNLLNSPERKKTIEQIENTLSFIQKDYDLFYKPLIERFVEHAQNLPETQFSYFSSRGGLIDLALKRTILAVSDYRHYLFPDQQITADLVTDEVRLWVYVIFSASLLHDIGKLYTKYEIELCDEFGKVLSAWNPLAKNMLSQEEASHYQYDFIIQTDVNLLHRATFLIAQKIMPDMGFEWISSDKTALATWLMLLIGDTRQVGMLTGIIPIANAKLIADYFKEKMAQEKKGYKEYREETDRPAETEKQSEEREASEALEKKIADREKVSKRLFASSHEKTDPSSTKDSGLAFLGWLLEKIEANALRINQKDAPINIVENGVLVSDSAFKKFITETKNTGTVESVRNDFSKLDITAKNSDGGDTFQFQQLNKPISSFVGPAQTMEMRGVLISSPLLFAGLFSPAISDRILQTSSTGLLKPLNAPATERTPGPKPSAPVVTPGPRPMQPSAQKK